VSQNISAKFFSKIKYGGYGHIKINMQYLLFDIFQKNCLCVYGKYAKWRKKYLLTQLIIIKILKNLDFS
jgi:hypothetical protein